MRIFIISVFLCAYALGTPFPIYHKDDKGYSTIIVKKPERIVIAGGIMASALCYYNARG